MHICVAGPIAGEDVRTYLNAGSGDVPKGYLGAPLTAILVGELLKLGHRVTAVTTDSELPLERGPVRLAGPDFSFVVCPARPRAWRPNGWHPGRIVDLFSFERRGVRQALLEASPDIVHAHWTYEFALAALDQPSPHLITCHDAPGVVFRFSRSPYRALRWMMARQVFARGKAFTTVSDYMARELAPSLIEAPQVVPNPIASHVLSMGRVRTATRSRRVAMVCNGWDRRKNPEPALRAFARWRVDEPKAELHLYGADFGHGEAAQRWAANHGADQGVQFHGRMPHRELTAALNQMDALLHPALEESFGVVLAEAMALGLPVVAGRESGAVPWVVGAEAGELADVRSDIDIVRALQTTFDERYESRSSAGRARAQDCFSPASVARAYEQRYLRVLRVVAEPAQAMASQPVVEVKP